MGDCTDRWSYTAFGELLSHAGEDINAYLFAGEMLDPNSGFYYNRARWMDPGAGRFASVDPFGGRITDPRTLHRYLYGAASPLSYVDPSGRDFSLSSVGWAMGIGAVVGAIATPLVNHAIGKPTTIRDVLLGAAIGAVAAGAATLSSVAAGGLLAVGLYGSGALVYDVFANPGSTWTQKVAASALLLAAVLGSGYAMRFAFKNWSTPRSINDYRVLHDLGADKIAAFYRSHGLRVSREVYVRNPHYKVGRRYDVVVKTSNNEYIGFEYKSTGNAYANPPARQVRADGWIEEHGGTMFGSAAEAEMFAGQVVTKVIRLGPGMQPPGV